MEYKFFEDNQSIIWLKENGSSITSIADSVSEPFIIINQHQIIYFNQPAKQLFKFPDDIDEEHLSIEMITANDWDYHCYFEYFSSLDTFDENTTHMRFKWRHQSFDDAQFDSEVILFSLEHSLKQKYWGCILCDLSSWKTERNALEVHYNQLYHLLNNANDITLIINPVTGLIHSANARALAFYEYNLNEIKTLNISRINILSQNKIKEEMAKATREERQHFFFKHRTKSGEIYDVKVLSGPIKIKDSAFLFSIVTPLKKQEQHDHYQLNYQELFSELHVPELIMTDSLQVITCNQAFCQEFGYNDYEIKNKNVGMLIVPSESIEETNFLVNQVKSNKKIKQNVVRERKDGSLHHYQLSATSIVVSGKQEPLILATYQNKDTLVKMKNENQFYEKIYNNLRDGVIITNSDYQIIWSNPAFESITGLRHNEVAGHVPPFRPTINMQENIWDQVQLNRQWSGEVEIPHQDKLSIGWLTLFEQQNETDSKKHYIGMLYDITDFKANENRIRQMAYFDSLTQLLSRGHFFDLIKTELITKNVPFTLYYIDLNDFKQINDQYGHHIGDITLKMFATHLQNVFNESLYLSRIGGDEFVAISKETTQENIELQVQKCEEISADPLIIEEHLIPLAFAIGYSIFPQNGKDIDHLLSSADHMMYRKKTDMKK